MKKEKHSIKPISTLLLVFAAGLLSIQIAKAGMLNDYRGTIGSQKIGMMIENASLDPAKEFGEVHYFYVRHLINIPLRLINRQNRKFSLEERDQQGKAVARFDLEFPEFDEFKHFSHEGPGKLKLEYDAIVGTWNSLDGNRSLPVTMYLHHAVDGMNGGRCGLTAGQYRHVENRAKSFRDAVLKNDVQRLKREFKYEVPRYDSFRQSIEDAVPHDLFCRNGVFILGNGPIGFNERGNIQ